jgi:heme-degrading monooxygenase HmoA
MVTVVTRVRIRSGQEAEWDRAFTERVHAAREQHGFELVQLCSPQTAPSERVIVGTWQTRDDWKAWHDNEAFQETRRRLEEVDEEQESSDWYEFVVEERR